MAVANPVQRTFEKSALALFGICVYVPRRLRTGFPDGAIWIRGMAWDERETRLILSAFAVGRTGK
jgi:hypothetical protein